jgi:hypothetical protein
MQQVFWKDSKNTLKDMQKLWNNYFLNGIYTGVKLI